MDDENRPQFWQEKYENNLAPWDLGQPSPVFERLVKDGRFSPGKMIVLGAGRGYDARLFARHGFAVTAVDFADEAVSAMRRQDELAYPVEILQADIFALPEKLNGRFDYVLEYTCYCAINPARRNEYARLVHRLLKPGGLWVALSFPIGHRAGGPPYVVQPDRVIERMSEHGFSLVERQMPPDSPPKRAGIEELLILKREGEYS